MVISISSNVFVINEHYYYISSTKETTQFHRKNILEDIRSSNGKFLFMDLNSGLNLLLECSYFLDNFEPSWSCVIKNGYLNIQVFFLAIILVTFLAFLTIMLVLTQLAFTCTKIAIKTLEQSVKYVQT